MARELRATEVVTGEVRFSYVNVWEPRSINGSDPKFSVALLIPKKDTKTVEAIKRAIEAAITEDSGAKLGKNLNRATLKTPLRDGDVEKPGDDVYRGHYFINATTKNFVQPVDARVNPILNQADFYSGCYGDAAINFYAFNSTAQKGIACGLNAIRKLRDGESLSGSGKAEDYFGAPETDPLLG